MKPVMKAPRMAAVVVEGSRNMPTRILAIWDFTYDDPAAELVAMTETIEAPMA